MRYTVLWTPAAERRLAAIWADANDRKAVASAADKIDALLRNDPHLLGESRSGSLRILFVAPLGVDIDVLETDRIVYVLTVWAFRTTR